LKNQKPRAETQKIPWDHLLSGVGLLVSLCALFYGCRADRLANKLAFTHVTPKLTAHWEWQATNNPVVVLVNQGPVEIDSLSANVRIFFFPSGLTNANFTTNMYSAWGHPNKRDSSFKAAGLAVLEEAPVAIPLRLNPSAEPAVVQLQVEYFRKSDKESFRSEFYYLIEGSEVRGPMNFVTQPKYSEIMEAIKSSRPRGGLPAPWE
jgi:hypothetical protein